MPLPLPALSCATLPDLSSSSVPAATSGLTLHPHTDARREAVEQSVRAIYAQRYGAHVPGFAPMLVALREGESVLAAAGYRAASTGPLFLESYLPAPVETLIGSQTGAVLQRDRIVEVGHLAASRGGEGRRLIQLLGPHLAEQGFDWIVGTVTQELRAMLVRLGVAPLTLGVADPASLGATAHVWGSYYEHHPIVLAIHLRRALRQHHVRQMRAAMRGGR